MFSDKYRFRNRYRITGQLTTLSLLHIGSGDPSRLHDRLRTMRTVERDPRRGDWIDSQLNGENPEVAAFYGHGNELRIPGSSLKGVLSAGETRNQIFGTVDPEGKAEYGGKVTFRDAVCSSRAPVTNADGYWLASRGTYVLPNVGINPNLRSAQENLLYYTEVAPPDTVFKVTLMAEDLEPSELLALRQRLADTFHPRGATLGAGTANGWGVVQWQETSVEVIFPADLKEWLRDPAKRFDALFQPDTADKLTPRLEPTRDLLKIQITLPFTGRMIVNDPTQIRGKSPRDTDERYVVGKTPIRLADGRVYLPASTVRGALRAQARRIWQTVKWEQANLNDVQPRETNPRQMRDVVESLAPFHQVFGAGGWKSPFFVPDFTLLNDEETITQHFVAIDRFHGGAAAKRKFQTRALDRPTFQGTISVDLEALQRAGVGDWFHLLLLFLLRDLQEGDIYFGAQAAKGFGHVKAQIQAEGGPHAELLQGVLRQDPTSLQDHRLADWNRSWEQTTNAMRRSS